MEYPPADHRHRGLVLELVDELVEVGCVDRVLEALGTATSFEA
jgi:hypothetical protein